MIVVSDASVVINLNRIGRLGLLREIYGRVVVPEAVCREVERGAPRLVESEASWIEVRAVKGRRLVAELAEVLDPGESEAIALLGGSTSALRRRSNRLRGLLSLFAVSDEALDRNDVEGCEGVDVSVAIDNGDFVFANGDQLRVRHPELASIGSANQARLESTGQFLADLVEVHGGELR